MHFAVKLIYRFYKGVRSTLCWAPLSHAAPRAHSHHHNCCLQDLSAALEPLWSSAFPLAKAGQAQPRALWAQPVFVTHSHRIKDRLCLVYQKPSGNLFNKSSWHGDLQPWPGWLWVNGPFLSAHSWIQELIYYSNLQGSREFSFRSRKICSVPLNCSAKMGQTIFSLAGTAEQDTVVITEHISSSYLRRIPPFYYEKPFIFGRKAPASSPALCTGLTASAPGPCSVC